MAEDIRQIQMALLEIYKALRQILIENDITFYASGGTALGALRHRGFIPWDDDLDLEIPRKDYERFCAMADDVLPQGLKLITWKNTTGYNYLFGKVICTDQAKVESLEKATGMRLSQGLFIDLFPADYFPKSRISQTIRLLWRGVIKSIMYHVVGAQGDAIAKKRFGAHMGRFLRPVFPSLRTERDCLRLEEKICMRTPSAAGVYMNISAWFQFDFWQFKGKCRICAADYGTMRFVPFEDTTVPVPENAEKYLFQRYRDWKKLPPEEARFPAHGNGELMTWRYGRSIVREQPMLSIVIANYNYGMFIEEAIRSVINQAWTTAIGQNNQVVLVLKGGEAIELIICDGGSKDDSLGVMRRYADKLAWCVSEPDKGQSEAFNKGFARATGKYLTWLNADDILVKGTLEKLALEIKAHPDCEWFTGNFFRFENGRVRQVGWGPHWYPGWLQWRTSPVVVFGPTSFFARTAYERVGKIDEQLHFAMDMDLWIRFIKAGIKQRRLRFFCWAFRLHSGSKTSDYAGHRRTQESWAKSAAERRYIFEKTGHNLDHPHTLQYFVTLAWRALDGSLLQSCYRNLLVKLHQVTCKI